MILHFLAPIFILMLFINPILKDVMVPDLLSSESYNIIKRAVVLIACIIRALTFRNEVQFSLDESY